MFVKEIDPQSRREERLENLTEGMIPPIGNGMFQLCIFLSIGAAGFVLNRFSRKIGIAKFEIGRFLIEDPHKRMPFCNIKETAWLEIVSNNFAPGLQIGEPANDPIGGIDDIKLTGRMQDVRARIQVAPEKRCVQMKLLAQ